MVLQLDLAGWVNRLIALPVILHRNVIDDKLVVEIDSHLAADHEDAEPVPISHRIVCALARTAGLRSRAEGARA